MSLLSLRLIQKRFYSSAIQQPIHDKLKKDTPTTSKSDYLIPKVFELDERKGKKFLKTQ